MNKKYKCQWCGNDFTYQIDYEPGKKEGYSSPVPCPGCGRLIQTWKREDTGRLESSKHFHIRK